MPANHQHAAREGDGSSGCSQCADMLCLLRLNEIVLGGADPTAGTKAMVDEIARLEGVVRAVVVMPSADGSHADYIAHFGLPGSPAHSSLSTVTPPMLAKAMATRQLVQLSGSEGGSSLACVSVPLLGSEQLLGGFALALSQTVPISAWTEEVIWAASELIALLWLDEGRAGGPSPGKTVLGLTRRQADVIYELVDRGASNAQIAAALGLSARTVKIHLQAAYRQLGVRRRGDAIRLILTKYQNWLQVERGRRRHGRPML
jgi:DNA-binding CsgD family transcriptional regulator